MRVGSCAGSVSRHTAGKWEDACPRDALSLEKGHIKAVSGPQRKSTTREMKAHDSRFHPRNRRHRGWTFCAFDYKMPSKVRNFLDSTGCDITVLHWQPTLVSSNWLPKVVHCIANYREMKRFVDEEESEKNSDRLDRGHRDLNVEAWYSNL